MTPMSLANEHQLVAHRKTQHRREIKAGLRQPTYRPGSVMHAYQSGSVQTWVDMLRSRSHWQDSCWLWMGEFDGATCWVTLGVARRRANRIYFELTGELDHTKRVVSRCGQPQCVNPEHREVQTIRRYIINDVEDADALGQGAR